MEQTIDEIKRLQGCINDLISILALPAIWSDHDPAHILSTLLDVLSGMLRLDFAYARLNDSNNGSPIEVVRLAQRLDPASQTQHLIRTVDLWLTRELSQPRLVVPNPIGEGEVSIARLQLGFQDEVGILVAGSRRADFPTEIENLLLRVAANQAAIGLQEARDITEHIRAEEELEQRVAERTRQLTAANEELTKEIIERGRAEAALRASEERFRSYFELGLIGMAITSPSQGCLEVNDELCRIFGYERSELLQKTWAEMTHPDDLAGDVAQFNRVMAGEMDGYTMDKRWIRKDGRVIDSIMAAQCLRRADGAVDYFVGLVLDTSERKRAEEELRTAHTELAHVARLTTMGELASSIAHEVNQPLAAVVTNGNAGLRWLAAATPNLDEAREAFGRIIRDGNRASDVIARIRALLKKTIVEQEQLNMNEAIEDTIALAQGELRRNGVTLRTDLARDLPPLMGDRVQLQQVVLNLLLNGIEAMGAAGGGPRELVVTTRKDQVDKLQVTIQDSGIGFEPQNVEKIFDAFYTTKRDGMGMGLSISRSIIEAHSGQLWATTNDGPGTTLHFTLPICNADAL